MNTRSQAGSHADLISALFSLHCNSPKKPLVYVRTAPVQLVSLLAQESFFPACTGYFCLSPDLPGECTSKCGVTIDRNPPLPVLGLHRHFAQTASKQGNSGRMDACTFLRIPYVLCLSTLTYLRWIVMAWLLLLAMHG